VRKPSVMRSSPGRRAALTVGECQVGCEDVLEYLIS
jgi:hypothetical protein